MSTPQASRAGNQRLLFLQWDGMTWELLTEMAGNGDMPNFAALMQSSLQLRLRWTGLGSAAAGWTTLRSGRGPWEHGIWDDSWIDHRRGWVLPVDPHAVPCPLLPELITAMDQHALCLSVDDATAGVEIWSRQPASYEELAEASRRTEDVLHTLVARVRHAAGSCDWRLLEVRLHLLASLEHRIWHLLRPNLQIGANPRWISVAQQTFALFDRALGELLELADRQDAAVAVASPHGFVPFREKITVAELLRRHQLFACASGAARMGHRVQRGIWRALRRLVKRNPGQANAGVHYPVAALMPVDWRRSRAVALHGDHAALVYLNAPDRFGTRALPTARARDQALADVLGALAEARHPVHGESLFADVFSTAERYPCDPLQRNWPDAIGIPAPGYQTRHRPDHRRHLLRSDPGLSATPGSDGLLLLQAPGTAPDDVQVAALTEVAGLVLSAVIGQPPSYSSSPALLGQ